MTDVELFNSIILERYSFFSDKIVETKILQLTAKDEKECENFREDYLYYVRIRDILNKYLNHGRVELS